MGSINHASVTVHALNAGYLTLPEAAFVTPLSDPAARKKVPSLSFLIQHRDAFTGTQTRIVFDLGIRKKLQDYAPPIYKHAMTRQPLSGDPDTITSLAAGGLSPDDIDMVMFSHLHWDHIGTPSDYPTSTYVVGPGAASLVNGTRSQAPGSHNHFEQGILDAKRLFELPLIGPAAASGLSTPPADPEQLTDKRMKSLFSRPWAVKGPFESTMDIFGDGSVYVVSAPGHLDGHINLLCRLPTGGYVYLAGDSCHDRRILTGEKDIATWEDSAFPGHICCIHRDKAVAEQTIRRIREAMSGETELGQVEVILAHDAAWEELGKERGCFFPGSIQV